VTGLDDTVPAAELERLHAQLRTLDATVAVAESLTGGALCAALTAPSGASTVVRGGVVVYATDLKATLAGVPQALLAERGAVDPDVALALATGVRERLRASYGLAVTGVAGPDPQDGKPVGIVYVGLAGPAAGRHEAHRFPGSRAEIRAATVQAALRALSQECERAITSLRSP
jgi:nicotinamide-nucleotide amidase